MRIILDGSTVTIEEADELCAALRKAATEIVHQEDDSGRVSIELQPMIHPISLVIIAIVRALTIKDAH